MEGLVGGRLILFVLNFENATHKPTPEKAHPQPGAASVTKLVLGWKVFVSGGPGPVRDWLKTKVWWAFYTSLFNFFRYTYIFSPR
jgi:hypothetical protein